MKFVNLYTSVACNRSLGCVDVNSNGLVAFGASHSVSILDVNSVDSKVVRTLIQHRKRVNIVKWISPETHGGFELISGGDDCVVIMWPVEKEKSNRLLEGHKGGVTALDTIHKTGRTVIATSASDSTVRIWENYITRANCFQVICLEDKVCLAVCLGIVPVINKICLAYSTNDSNIHLLLESNAQEFDRILVLYGHDNWVQGLDFIVAQEVLLLASASLDATIRLWRISNNLEKCDFSKIIAGSSSDPAEIEFTSNSANILVTLESIMQGHDNWVHSVHWNQGDGHPKLLSCSADKTMIVWSVGDDGVWNEEARLGDVGGSIPGYYGGKFSPDGKSVVAYGFCGGLQIWIQAKKGDEWNLSVSLSGHFGPVRCVSWEPGGKYLLSASADQTTLLHGQIHDSQGGLDMWKIIARPQEHGYEIRCVATVDEYNFASVGEEKLVRVFSAIPKFNESVSDKFQTLSDFDKFQISSAAIKPLNLSTRAISLNNMALSNIDETLLTKFRWTESRKLYGHGHEVFTLCCTPNGEFLASSSKLMPGECARILIWETTNWTIIQRISTNQSTITQMKFSSNGSLLLSVSKDRSWVLFKRCSNKSSMEFHLQAISDKVDNVHKRIIWCCDWSHDSRLFATGSRDGKLALWHTYLGVRDDCINPSLFCVEDIKGESVTACAFTSRYYRRDMYLLACGLESGMIKLYSVNRKLSEVLALDRNVSHHLSVESLEFRPVKHAIQLASSGADNIIRIYEFFENDCSTITDE